MKSRSRTAITNEPRVTALAALWLSKRCQVRSLLTSISPPTRRTTAEPVLSVTARRLLCASAAREPSWLSAACADVPTAAVCIIAGSRRLDLLGRRRPRPEEVAGVAVKPNADRFPRRCSAYVQRKFDDAKCHKFIGRVGQLEISCVGRVEAERN